MKERINPLGGSDKQTNKQFCGLVGRDDNFLVLLATAALIKRDPSPLHPYFSFFISLLLFYY